MERAGQRARDARARTLALRRGWFDQRIDGARAGTENGSPPVRGPASTDPDVSDWFGVECHFAALRSRGFGHGPDARFAFLRAYRTKGA